MTPVGTVVDIKRGSGVRSLIKLYNLYGVVDPMSSPASVSSSGQALDIMEQIANNTLAERNRL